MKTRNIISLGFVILIFILIVFCCCRKPPNLVENTNKDTNLNGNLNQNVSNVVTASPTPILSPTITPEKTVVDLESPEIKEKISKGEQLYKKIESRYKLPVMFSWRGQNMTLLIPIDEWNKMTKTDQINLTFYAQNLVLEIRKNPIHFVDSWISYYKTTEQLEKGMEYDGLYKSSYVEQVQKLCGDCWDITVGKVKRDGFYDEAYPVKGATVQSFRENTEKEIVKTSEQEKAKDQKDEKEEFKNFASSMLPSEHLAQAVLALNTNYDPSQEKFGNTFLARKHIKAISKDAPEYKDAQKLLQKVVHREKERKEFQDSVIRDVRNLAN